MILRIGFIALIVFLTGCSTFKNTLDASKPNASVTSVSIGDISMETVTLLVGIEVYNPNSFALKAAGFDLDLLIDNSTVASIGQPDASLTLPAKGSNRVQLPVTLTFDEILSSMRGLGDKTEVDYGVQGKVAVNLPVLGSIDMPVEYSGVLPIPKQPEVTFKNLNVDSIGFSGVKLSVDLEVMNPNVFDINLNDVTYQLDVESKSLGGGNIKTINLPQGEFRVISIPLSIGVSDMGTSLYRLLIGSEPVSVDVSIEAEVDTNIDGWKSVPVTYEMKQELN
ncbi:NDR1/HIN1-like protein [Marinomonas colpomeniae]|uniref:LEA type 2 family protein n=1 Tax=Marinomonas colpomeniae TaxID=2774408 RepID=A0ABR8NX64_9GAMM|nr:LEA type 2 family protein [Marinomonas colpomeniae]MBD5770094.1 LEA type 2 family protein [Marinomonas colpomeniae]